MKLYYDLHIHTGLSPCGDNDMTPNNIVNMSLIKELDCIAITDHNTCGNVGAVMNAAKGSGLIVLPGMEVETTEEIHVVCLFPTLDAAAEMGRVVASRLPVVKNKEEIFGNQYYYDEEDNVIGSCENLLVTATTIGMDELVSMVRDGGGVPIPAHVDRQSYSIISNLGFIPEELGIRTIEISKNTEPDVYLIQKKLDRNFGYVQSSDAHYLHDISERQRYLTFDKVPDAVDIICRLNDTLLDRHFEKV